MLTNHPKLMHIYFHSISFKISSPTSSSSSNNKLSMGILYLVLVLMLSCALMITCCTEHERNCLLQFQAGLSQDGGLAASWRQGTDCCSWEGITCSSTAGKVAMVTDVLLASKKLQGSVSPALGRLPGLLHLNLSHNSLSGSLPSEMMSSGIIVILDVSLNSLGGVLPPPPLTIGLMKLPMRVLDISTNKFTEEFPSLEAMANLVSLNGSNNSFTGMMPVAPLCRASPSLALLDLSYNKFTGEVYLAVANCSMLKVLKARNNYLSGTLPSELFDMTSLEHISFTNNGLQGELHGAHIAKLNNLITLEFGENDFHGEIPESIGQLKKLEKLSLGNNKMSGYLPSSLSNCTRLTTIDLKINNFGGDLGKVDFSALHNLKTLDLLANNFNGVIPESIYSCSNLTALRLSSNHLHGEISSRIGDLKHLSFLSLANNSFTNIAKVFHALKSCQNLTSLLIGQNFLNEAMPQTIDGFENLQCLTIEQCSLTGTIPLWISKLKNLKLLDLSGNRLTGSMPSWINSLNNLFYLDVSNNRLSGQIPVTLMEMPMLRLDNIEAYLTRPFDLSLYKYIKKLMRQYRAPTSFPALFNLSTNNFTGMIPAKIGELKALTELDFSGNKLHGEIPPAICNLTNLRVLDLSSNYFTGPIPEALNKLNFLSELNMSNNDLEGPIPTGGQMSTFSSSSFDGNPKLCGPVLAKHCDLVEVAPTVPAISEKVISMVAFGVFFGIGVLYDQLVLSSYFV